MEDKSVFLPCTIHLEIRDEIDRLALESDRDRSKMVRLLLRLGIEEYKKRELEKFQD